MMFKVIMLEDGLSMKKCSSVIKVFHSPADHLFVLREYWPPKLAKGWVSTEHLLLSDASHKSREEGVPRPPPSQAHPHPPHLPQKTFLNPPPIAPPPIF